jgi:hypothetical protein
VRVREGEQRSSVSAALMASIMKSKSRGKKGSRSGAD